MEHEATLRQAGAAGDRGRSPRPDGEPLLSVRGLSVRFDGAPRNINVVDEVSFSVGEGKTLCLVGESGCGKSVTSLALMGLLPTPPARIVAGSALFDGRDLLTMPERERADLRGDRMAMIFQEPMTSLNPAFTIGDQIAEGIVRHRKVSKAEAMERALEMLRKVRIPAPEKRLRAYPHEMSGGMRQRVMIAMALANDPQLLIADEPTTALDVTIQAQILDLMRNLRDETGTAIILITHDLGVVAEMCDRVAVMYAGEIVEQAPAARLFARPSHPYTRGLLDCIPVPGKVRPGERLGTIPGLVPAPIGDLRGCQFRNRCPQAQEICALTDFALKAVNQEVSLRCRLAS
jgi:peptide/nickel transport system ATP-binding protein